jgi:hypothetical protein
MVSGVGAADANPCAVHFGRSQDLAVPAELFLQDGQEPLFDGDRRGDFRASLFDFCCDPFPGCGEVEVHRPTGRNVGGRDGLDTVDPEGPFAGSMTTASDAAGRQRRKVSARRGHRHLQFGRQRRGRHPAAGLDQQQRGNQLISPHSASVPE